MLPLLVLLFIGVPILELYVILQVGQAIGVLPTVALLIADSIVGSMLMRSQGRRAWRAFNAALTEGRVPAREVLDGVLVIFGGALLLTPGFTTDIFGALLLLPPTRAVIRRLLVRRFAARMVVAAGTERGPSQRTRGSGRRRTGERPSDVEGTATEVDPQRLRDGRA
jgi:UPF0716 protein FxsA